MRKSEKISKIKELLLAHYGEAKTELVYRSDYELLVCIILLAQCTDKRVNIITPALFEKFPTVYDMANANLDELKSFINSCSFFNNKAENLLKMAKTVVDEYVGVIPNDEARLQ